MPTCPLCESIQAAGDACAVCGRAFAAGEAVRVPVATLAELEATRHPVATSGDLATPRLAELEPTSERDARPVAGAQLVEGYSRTGAEPVEVEVAPLEVERVGDDALLRSGPAPEPLAVACRYCRTPATPGARLCTVCGMRLPLVRPSAPAAAVGAAPCRDCGIPMAGDQCPACGARRSTLG